MAVTVRSSSGNPSACIIDCEGEGRGFCFCRGEMADSIVSGFTICNGYANDDSYGGAYGGGVYCVYSSPTLMNCRITGNAAGDSDSDYGLGGGVCCDYFAGPTLVNCTIDANAAYGSYWASGGGVACFYHSSPALTNCTITGNTCEAAYADGGGLGCSEYSSPTVTGCTISGNSSESEWQYASGGGISCDGLANATLIDCTISGNEAAAGGGASFSDCSPTVLNCSISLNVSTGTAWMDDFYTFGGGGVLCEYSVASFVGCRISGNTAYVAHSSFGDGGGVCCFAAEATFTNCVIADNAVIGSNMFVGSGGGVYSYYSIPSLINCTLSGNQASYKGGGLYGAWSEPTLTNCILWGDAPEEIGQIHGEPAITFCDVQGASRGTGNICIDPAFVGTGSEKYRLRADSPCIDAGRNAAMPGGVQTDLDGYPRFVDDPATQDCPYLPGACGASPLVDLGAHEYQVATGACCTGTYCTITRQPDCAGTWLGGVTCGSNPCQTGSCCVGNACTVTIQASCAGMWTGGATCGANSPCQTGSCCTSTACSVTTQANCAGTWTSGGTCSPNNPCQTGSCCTGTACTVTTQANCAGTWTNGGTCSPNNPCQTGSCCVGTTCTVTTQANCAGTWTNGGTCSPSPCAVDEGPFVLACGTNGSGTVTVNPPGGTYESGTVVYLQAIPAAGWSFLGWTGDAQGTNSSVSVVMDGPRTAIARFARATVTPAASPTAGLCGLSAAEAGLTTLLVFLAGPSVARGVFRRRRSGRGID
jgi:hypothetical protein